MGTAELASAVSNAGGLGILTALIWPEPEGLRKEIRRCRTMTSKPFAVNITLLPAFVPPDYDAYAQVVIDEGINIVETAGNSPGPVISKLKKAGCIVLHKCTSIRHAISAVKLGVDFLSIDGFECAGYVFSLVVPPFCSAYHHPYLHCITFSPLAPHLLHFPHTPISRHTCPHPFLLPRFHAWSPPLPPPTRRRLTISNFSRTPRNTYTSICENPIYNSPVYVVAFTICFLYRR